MIDPFIAAAGPAPARDTEGRWRQVALLGLPAAAKADPRARAGLAAALVALDVPEAAGPLVVPGGEEPWARWWRTLAVGQLARAEGLADALAAARAEPDVGPDGREVARRLDDLAAELAELGLPTVGEHESLPPARFSLQGHSARPERRVLLVGRSSASFLIDPSWDALRLVRLAPSEGPSAGNRAHLGLPEVLAQVRRGEAGAARDVPGDQPAGLDPAAMLTALREDPAHRDLRLIALAEEVKAERVRLADERLALETERAELHAERSRLRRLRPAPAAPGGTTRAARAPLRLPRTPPEAAAALGLAPEPATEDVERAYREQIVRCHPDRVADLHPSIQARAADLTVTLNAARDILLGRDVPRRRAAGGTPV